ncbi:MAG: bifunctional diaminohydroxyphosphoribosylaminopyrimidine deaminase/5-amino-6-(5-phosphoribosylamino)uracil reductase RibD [Caulobacteraceae bacterium]
MADSLDEAMMRRAIAVAMGHLGKTAPNPTVGCVIARGQDILAEAATAPGGSPHAEEQAVPLAGVAAKGATAYVTLEPCGARSSGACSCSEHLVSAGISRVVIACEDVSPLASGQGLQRLQAAGLKVELGVLEAEADVLSAGFRHRLATGMVRVEAANSPESYEGIFDPGLAEDVTDALRAAAARGLNRLWTPRNGEVAERLRRVGLLFQNPLEALR